VAKNRALPVLVLRRIRYGDCLALDTVKELLNTDWKETGLRLAGYAAFRARNLAWRTGRSDSLAKGLMPDDIAAQAILSVISGERSWDPEKGPLLPFLKRVVDSLLNHLAESSDNRRVEPLFSEHEEALHQQRVELLADCGEKVTISQASLVRAELVPEPEDSGERKIQQLFAVAKEKPELAELLQAILDFDEVRPRCIALRIGKSVAHVNNCLKRLRRLALKISTTAGRTAVSGGALINP
jgi:hypothetical protein